MSAKLKNRLQYLAGIMKECDCQEFDREKDLLEEDVMEAIATVAGLLTSGVITALLVTHSKPVMDSVNHMSNQFTDYMETFRKNYINSQHEKQVELTSIVKNIAKRFNGDQMFLTILQEINKNIEDYKQGFRDSKNRLNVLIPELEKYVVSKLSPEEKKHVKKVVDFMTNNFRNQI
jgi:hypothetical protein